MLTPTEVLSSIPKNPTDIDHVRSLVAPDVTHVSLNYDNPDLKRIMPWAGTSQGPESIVKTFVDVRRYWQIQSFEPEALFGSEVQAAMFGRFIYKSAVLSKVVTSPLGAPFADDRCRESPACNISRPEGQIGSAHPPCAWSIRIA
jgi:uncharacterized protein